MSDESLGVSPSGPGSSLQPQAASAAIPDAACNGRSAERDVEELLGLADEYAEDAADMGSSMCRGSRLRLEGAIRAMLARRQA